MGPKLFLKCNRAHHLCESLQFPRLFKSFFWLELSFFFLFFFALLITVESGLTAKLVFFLALRTVSSLIDHHYHSSMYQSSYVRISLFLCVVCFLIILFANAEFPYRYLFVRIPRNRHLKSKTITPTETGPTFHRHRDASAEEKTHIVDAFVLLFRLISSIGVSLKLSSSDDESTGEKKEDIFSEPTWFFAIAFTAFTLGCFARVVPILVAPPCILHA